MGIVGLIEAFQGGGWGPGILGTLSIIFGIILLSNTMLAVSVLAPVLSIFMIVGGIFAIFMAFRLRSADPVAYLLAVNNRWRQGGGESDFASPFCCVLAHVVHHAVWRRALFGRFLGPSKPISNSLPWRIAAIAIPKAHGGPMLYFFFNILVYAVAVIIALLATPGITVGDPYRRAGMADCRRLVVWLVERHHPAGHRPADGQAADPDVGSLYHRHQRAVAVPAVVDFWLAGAIRQSGCCGVA